MNLHVNDLYIIYIARISRDAGTRKGPGGQTLLKGTNKILIMLKNIPWNLEGQLHSSCAKFLPIIFCLFLANSAITLDINRSQISSIDSAQRVLLSLTKGTLKTYSYMIFFILKGHFCPPCPTQQKARGAAAPPAPPVPASLRISLFII